jgi:single-strand DNA-binding protein
LVRCVSCFYTNAQFFGILFFAILPRLCRVDSTPTNMDASVAEELQMNSFTLTAVGHLARNPEVVAKGDVACTRFCLIGNDYAGKDDEGTAREVTTSLWFRAFGAIGDSIAQHARKGDQLIVEARVKANNWTDKQGEKQYDLTFVVQGFRFGAPGKVKREEFNGRREQTLGLPRTEDRGNGHDPHPAQALNGAGDGHEERTDSHPDEVGDQEVESEIPAAAPGYGAVASVSEGSRPTLEVRESSSTAPAVGRDATSIQEVKVGQEAKATPESKATYQPQATHEPKATQQKPRGGRSARKTATSAA